MQRRILIDLHNRLLQIRQFYSCSQRLSVPGSSLVDTSEGLVQVKELENKNFELVSNGQILSSQGFKLVKKPEKIYKITTKNNFSITCSDNTRFLVQGLNKKEKPYFKYLWQLEVGDAVYFNWGQAEQFVYNKEVDHKAKDLGWLVGEVIGDGSHNTSKKYQSRVEFFDKNREVLAWHAYRIISLYLPKTRQQLRQSKGPVISGHNQLTIALKCLTDLCSRYITDYDKYIKTSTLYESKPFLMGLIQGFLDADGHVDVSTYSAVILSNTNLHNLLMVQAILRWIGIVSGVFSCKSIRTYKITNSKGVTSQGNGKREHKLYIKYLSQLLRYQEIVDFNDPDKREKLIYIIQNRKLFTAFSGFLQITQIQSIEEDALLNEQFFVLQENNYLGCNGFYIHAPNAAQNQSQYHNGEFVNRWQVDSNLIRQKWEQLKITIPKPHSNST